MTKEIEALLRALDYNPYHDAKNGQFTSKIHQPTTVVENDPDFIGSDAVQSYLQEFVNSRLGKYENGAYVVGWEIDSKPDKKGYAGVRTIYYVDSSIPKGTDAATGETEYEYKTEKRDEVFKVKVIKKKKAKDEMSLVMDMTAGVFDADEGDWVTINGTHVLIGEGGEVKSGPAGLKGKTMSKAESSKSSSKSGPSGAVKSWRKKLQNAWKTGERFDMLLDKAGNDPSLSPEDLESLQDAADRYLNHDEEWKDIFADQDKARKQGTQGSGKRRSNKGGSSKVDVSKGFPKTVKYDGQEWYKGEEMTGGARSYMRWDENNNEQYITVQKNGEIESN